MPEKLALIIGINDYAYMDSDSQLEGCVNDARLMRNALIYKFGFELSKITELHDKAATKGGILAAMKSLLQQVKNDDIVVFHYSGHGSRCKVTTQFSDEGSGKDNCLLPHDDSEPKADGSKEFREIRDDVINEWLRKLTKKTSNITLIFDACHSGTITRGVKPEAKARQVDEEVRDQPATVRRSQSRAIAAKRGAGGWLSLNNNFVVISGCRDTQRSKERSFDEANGSYRHGVLTYNLIGELNKAQPGTTYRDVFDVVSGRVAAAVVDQNPQIEGSIDRELFGVKDIEPLQYLPLTKVDGKVVTVAGGTAHGLKKGSKLAIYPAGTKTTEGVRVIDSATIFDLGATESHAHLSETNAEVLADCRCVVSELAIHNEPLKAKVIGSDARAVSALNTELRKSKLLVVNQLERGADIQLVLLNKGSEPANDLAKTLGERGEILDQSDCWACFYDDGSLAFDVHAKSERAINNLLRKNLEKIAQYRRTLALMNPATTIKAEFNLYKRTGTSELILANGGGTEFTEGDGMVLEITNHETDRSLFVSLLWLGADMSIGQFYPRRKNSEEIAPGTTIRIGDPTSRLNVGIAKSISGKVVSETCKLMVTTHQSDFTWLNQEATRSNISSLSAVKDFDIAFRGSKSEKPVKPKDDWLAINRMLTIHRVKTSRD